MKRARAFYWPQFVKGRKVSLISLLLTDDDALLSIDLEFFFFDSLENNPKEFFLLVVD